eukprot:TRINITY_DN138_c1_g1_i1.p1 TRINITY_DN138_c1_g1~~TRINITY_DN138_c1_g1_i1.p1  ORF type:complete len:143 (+),score=49.49 TRINITY_DN138_c1_g1_i1:58-429(+)
MDVTDEDLNSIEVNEALVEIANTLGIPLHPNPRVMLQAIHQSTEILIEQSNKEINEVDQQLFSQLPLGFDTGDNIVNDCSKVLRLQHVIGLREIQVAINAKIGQVQSVTANPKTNTKLGKVGR